MRYVPWHVKGVRPEGREAARDAARRSGLSLTAWLNSLIIDAAAGNCQRSLAELSDAVKLLSTKADSIAIAGMAPERMQELEHAIAALQSLASQVASQDVIAILSHEIKTLSDKIDRNNRPAAGSDFMNTLEQRPGEIAEAVGRCRPDGSASLPANFDAIIAALADRLEAVQISAAGEGALKTLEEGIGMLAEKLANFEAQSDRRGGVDRRMEELLVQLRELRAENESRLAAIQREIAMSAARLISSPAESIRREVASLKEIQTLVDRRTKDTFEAVYGTIEQVVDRLAVIENELRDRHFAPHADRSADEPDWCSEPTLPPCPRPQAEEGRKRAAPAMVAEAPALAAAADRALPAPPLDPQGEHDWVAMAPSNILPPHPSATTARLRHPAVPDFASDASLASVAGARGGRVAANAIDRIAASEAGGPSAKPAETSAPVRAKFVAAARRAAQAVVSEHKEMPTDRFEESAQDAAQNLPLGTLFKSLRPRAKSVILSISVVLLVLAALHTMLDFFHTPAGQASVRPVTEIDDGAPTGGEPVRSEQPPPDQPPTRQDTNLESPLSPVPYNTNILPDEPTPAALPYPPPQEGARREGASLPMRNELLPGTAGRDPEALSTPTGGPDLTATPLPPTIGGKGLLAAASAGDPGASYEIAMRFAQGRNADQDLAMAAAWLERAARSGLAPAQFRLGSMYEKGLGVKKDLAEARRLYIAAAGKGHAKAMHNLAVLYAGGLDGKPNYATASRWFRRAADHGVVDSQYNLAILYARGVGIERNFAESYKWFALAAKGGDRDAARKRDEVALRLDPKQLESARLNAESFLALPQPYEATAVKAPAGGWDQEIAAATTKSKAPARAERFPGK